MTASFDAKAFLSTLTEHPGVYRMLGSDGQVLYVGKAKNLRKRVSSYFRAQLPSPRIAHMVAQIASIETTVTRSEAEALLLENHLIKSLAPRYNILFRDDKSYPYITLSRDAFPRLGYFRGNPDRKADYYGPYPSGLAVRDAIHLLQKMFRLRTCEDAVFANRSRPCLLYQIRRCTGPCVGRVSAKAYEEDVASAALFLKGKESEVISHIEAAMEEAASRLAFEEAARFRDQLRSLKQLQEKQFVASSKGEDVDIVVAMRENGLLCVNLAMVRAGRHLGDRPHFPLHAGDSTPEEGLTAFLLQHYAAHPAPARIVVQPKPVDQGDEPLAASLAQLLGRVVPVSSPRASTQRAWVSMAEQNARLAITARVQATVVQESRLQALQSAIGFQERIERIECFDISHTQGEATVASCVVYHGTGMKKSDYRRFNVVGIQPGDDYAAMRQVVTRRYEGLAAGEGVVPDLVLIDGGKGQIASAHEALADMGVSNLLMLLGVAKGEGRKPGLETLVFADGREPLQLPAEHPALHLIQEIRDEAHRFAITGHRNRRDKTRRTSTLESIPGVGSVRRKALVARFGGLQGVLKATVGELAAVPGISQELAERIYQALH